MEGDMFQYTVNISAADICMFLVCIVTNLCCYNSFSKYDDLSPYNGRKHLSRKHLSHLSLILLFTIWPWNIQIRGQ